MLALDPLRPFKLRWELNENNIFKFEFPHHTDIINLLMSDRSENQREKREIVLALLADKHDVHKFGTNGLIDRIGRETDTEYAKKFVKLVKQRRGPFNKLDLYDLKDPQTANAIRSLEYLHPLIKSLRQEILRGQTNLLPKEYEVKIIYSDKLPTNRAAVCKKSEYYLNRIRLFRSNSVKTVRIQGALELNHEKCNETPNKVIQISSEYTEFQKKNVAIARAAPVQFYELPVSPVH